MLADDDPRWDVVRLQVKAGEKTRNRICHEHGITPQRLARRIKECKWDVEEDATSQDRRILVGELLLATEKQVLHLLDAEMSETGERESALLGRLTTTLDRLIALDTRVSGGPATARRSKEMTELRTRIAKRLDELQIK